MEKPMLPPGGQQLTRRTSLVQAEGGQVSTPKGTGREAHYSKGN
jgi:hypothetical protein